MRFYALAALTLAMCLCACGGATQTTSNPDPDPPKGRTPVSDDPVGSPPEAAPGLPAIDATISRIHIEHVFLGGVADCVLPYRSVDYDRTTRLMSWPACERDGGPDAGTVTEAPAVARVLSPSEAQSVEDILGTVTYKTNPTCGGLDGEEYYMSTFDRAGDLVRKYSARNINCYGLPSATLIYAVYDQLAKLRG